MALGAEDKVKTALFEAAQKMRLNQWTIFVRSSSLAALVQNSLTAVSTALQ